MSRYVQNIQEGVDVVYGHDHATGYFFQKFDGVDEDGEDILTIDECSLFTNMSNQRMLELMVAYKVNMDHLELMMMDLPF
jgi:hypothetical protein